MAEPWLGVVEKLTEFFATAQIEASARGARGLSGARPRLPARCFWPCDLGAVEYGARPPWGNWRPKRRSLPTPVDISPEALHQRMTRRAVAFLRALLQRAFAKLHTGDTSVTQRSLPRLPPSYCRQHRL